MKKVMEIDVSNEPHGNEPKIVMMGIRDQVNGEIKRGDGMKTYEFNTKTFVLQRCQFRKMPQTWIDKIMLKIFGLKKANGEFYYVTAISGKVASKLLIKKFNPPFIKLLGK